MSSRSGSGTSSGTGKAAGAHKRREEKKTSESRKYAQIPKETVMLFAQTVLGDKIGDDIAKPLAEDVSYRLREVINACSTYISQANHNCLTTDDVNQVLENKDVMPVFGHSGGGIVSFQFSEETNLFVEDDPEVDVLKLALSNSSIVQKGNHFIKSMWLLPSSSMEDSSDAGSSSVHHNGVADTIPLPENLVNYYKHAYRVIFGQSKSLFTILTENFRNNDKVDPVMPYIIEALAQALDEADKGGIRRFWLLDATDALLDNQAVDLSPSMNVNKIVTSLLHCVLDVHLCKGGLNFTTDSDFRKKSSYILSKVLRQWCGSVIVREVIRKLDVILQDGNISLPVHRGAISLLAAMGQATLALSLWPLLMPPGTYATFLGEIQSSKDLVIDYEDIKDTILVAAESLHRPEKNIDEDENEIPPVKKRPTQAEIEHNELAIGVQKILYEQFGDCVCCRWPLPPNSSCNRIQSVANLKIPFPRIQVYKVLKKVDKIGSKLIIPKTTSRSSKPRMNMSEVFDRIPPLHVKLPLVREAVASMFSHSRSRLVPKNKRSSKRQVKTQGKFHSHSRYQRILNSVKWVGRIKKSREFAFDLTGLLKINL